MKAGKRLRHRLDRPFRAWFCYWHSIPGRCPGLAWAALLALKSDAPKGQTTLAQGNALGILTERAAFNLKPLSQTLS
jgi:hypothetical protein